MHGKSTKELQVIAQNIYSKITGIVYCPFNSTNAEITKLYANQATLDNLITENAQITNAEIEALKASKIDATTVQAQYMSVANWTSAGYIRADRIKTSEIVAELGEITNLNLQTTWMTGLNLNGYFTYKGSPVVWNNVTLEDGTTIYYLGGV